VIYLFGENSGPRVIFLVLFSHLTQGYHGVIKEWYQKNACKMKLHIDTKDWIEGEVYVWRKGDKSKNFINSKSKIEI